MKWTLKNQEPLDSLRKGENNTKIRSIKPDFSESRITLLCGHGSGALAICDLCSEQAPLLEYLSEAHRKSIKTIYLNDHLVVPGSADHTIRLGAEQTAFVHRNNGTLHSLSSRPQKMTPLSSLRFASSEIH